MDDIDDFDDFDFSDAIAAQLAGANVRATPLVGFDFRSGWKGYWPGFGPLRAMGKTFEGIGNLGSLSPMESGAAGGVDEMTFSLSAPPEALVTFREDMEETIGREVNVWLQFLDARRQDENGNWVEWLPLDEPLSIFVGTMGPLSVRHDPGSTEDRPVRIMSVTAQNAFTNRSKPQFAWFTDGDQKARSPTGDDNMFVLVSRFVDQAQVTWPKF